MILNPQQGGKNVCGVSENNINRAIPECFYLKKISLLIFSLILLYPFSFKAQDASGAVFRPVDGLSVASGLRYLVVKDEYISKEKYSGSSSFFALDWSKYHETYNFHVTIDFVNNAKINNFNISAYLSEFDLSLSYLYSIGSLNILNREAHFYLGPVPEFFYYFRHQNIAFTANSKTSLISGGIRIEMFYPLGNRWDIEGYMQSSILSLDQGESTEANGSATSSQSEIVTLFSGLRYSFSATVRYILIKNFSIDAGYQFNLVRSTAWDYFISSNDNLTASLTYSF